MENKKEQNSKKPCPDRISKVEVPVVQSQDLFRGSTQVLIHHNLDTYVLRITRNGKLIMNK